MGTEKHNRVLPLTGSTRVHRSTAVELPPLDVRSLLQRHNLRPRKGLGQNFLIDHNALRKIVESAEIHPSDAVLEIGAGLGSLTRMLAFNAASVKAVEIDQHLIAPLHEVVDRFANVAVVQGDILEIDPAQLMGAAGYIVVANIPYYITSAIMRHLLESTTPPSRLVLTVQKEVAERICAQPGYLSLLALSVQVYGDPKISAILPARAFYPAPNVDSATLRVDLHAQPFFNPQQRRAFFTLIHMGFAQKRKTLRNTLAAGLHVSGERAAQLLLSAGIDPQRRAQELSLVEWKTLVLELGELLPTISSKTT